MTDMKKSSRKLLSISMVLLIVPAMTYFLASKGVVASGDDQAKEVYYTTSSSLSTGNVELLAIQVSGKKITTTDIGPINAGGCASLAMSPSGKLLSMCGDLFGNQQLASIDTKTGHGTLFGVPVPGLAIMAMAFGPSGILYAVGDCNPNGARLECGPGPSSDPNYNSLYTVNETTGAVTRVGPTGAPQYFMDLTFDRDGNMLGVTTTLQPSYIPAILYRIDPETGAATKIVNLVGSNTVMGLAVGRDGKLYGSDYVQNAGFYLIDPKTGFETAISALPPGASSGLELSDPLP
jgi:hypothetical protein